MWRGIVASRANPQSRSPLRKRHWLDLEDQKRVKKNFRRGGSNPPPEVRHGIKPLNLCPATLGRESFSDYTFAKIQCQSTNRPEKELLKRS